MSNCQAGPQCPLNNPTVSPSATHCTLCGDRLPREWGDGHDDHECAIVPKPIVHTPPTTTALRALDYRKRTGGRWQRCSRCHRENELVAPVLYNLAAPSDPTRQPKLIPIMVGNDLVGFVCRDCFHPTLQHVASAFPDAMGFPHVDDDGMLVPTPRCSCGAPLHYASDGRTLRCSEASRV